jgi:hypothetical protein
MDVTPQQRWAIITDLFCKGLPRRRFTRLILSDLLMDNEPGTLRSSNDIPDNEIIDLIDALFPGCQEDKVKLDDYPHIYDLAKKANELVDTVYPHPPQPTIDPEERARRGKAKLQAYKERRRIKRQAQYEKREAKRQAKKAAMRQDLIDKHLAIPEAHEPTLDNGKLEKLNAWRAKAGLPPVEELS